MRKKKIGQCGVHKKEITVTLLQNDIDIRTPRDKWTERQEVHLTCVKKSCLRMRSRLALSSGILAKRLAISCLACGDSNEGSEYLASLIHL